MRYTNKEHENLYNQYFSIAAKNIASNTNLTKREVTSAIWKLITGEGIWHLPISTQYGGKGKSWQDCIAAFEGILKNYFCTEIISLFISQVNSLYLISHYGTESIKKTFLARLMQGEMSSIHISQSVTQLFNPSEKIKIKENFLAENKINICIEINTENKIIYCIKEKKLTPLSYGKNKIATTVEFAKNKIVGNEIEKNAIYDLLSFERLMYAVFAGSFIDQCKLLKRSNMQG